MSYKLTRLVFILAVVVCVPLRIYLKLFSIDPSSGFYEGNPTITLIFNIVLGVSVIALVALGLLQKSRPAAPTRGGKAVRILAVASGAAALLFCVTEIMNILGGYTSLTGFPAMLALLFQLVGIASGVIFLWIGFIRRTPLEMNGAVLLIPLLWQLFLLLSWFMSYTAIRSASDQMLAVVMLILVTPFLLAHGRILGNVNPKKGALHLAAFGFPFSLLALTFSTGTIAASLSGMALDIAPSLPAAIFYLLLGLYATTLCFES